MTLQFLTGEKKKFCHLQNLKIVTVFLLQSTTGLSDFSMMDDLRSYIPFKGISVIIRMIEG